MALSSTPFDLTREKPMNQRQVAMSMRVKWIITLFILVLPFVVDAAGINIQPGASISLDGGSIDLGCGDATVVGDLDIGSGTMVNTRDVNINGGNVNAGSGQIQLSGDWRNTGSFTPGTSQVTIQDGCSTNTSAITGATSFFDFSVYSVIGKILRVEAGTTQQFSNSLTLNGSVGTPLMIRSSVDGSNAVFALGPGGTQSILAVDVKDNSAIPGQWLAPGIPASFESIDSGNNMNWFLNVFEQVPVPTLSWPAVIILTITLIAVVFRRRNLLLKPIK